MSADNYMLVRKSVPSGRWWVQMGFMSDDSHPDLPTAQNESYGHCEDALKEAACRETEYGIMMGEEFPDPVPS